MSARPAPRAKSARTPKSRIPLALAVTARALTYDDETDAGLEYLQKELARADAAAARLLLDPITTLESPRDEMEALARANSFDEAADDIVKAIGTNFHDPHALISAATMAWADGALLLGLCLGFRIAADLGAKGGAQ